MFTVVEDIIKSNDQIPGPVKESMGSSGSLLLMREAVTAEENGSAMLKSIDTSPEGKV